MTYLLDTTSIIAIISDITNDNTTPTRFGNVEAWRIKKLSVYFQVIDEAKNPLLPKLLKELEGKKLVTTQIALDKTIEIINLLGSKGENERLKEFSKKMEIIPSDPSDRVKKMNSKIWSELNKSVFGTGDKLKIKVVTGNKNLAKQIVEELNLDIDMLVHRARCFVGKKFEPGAPDVTSISTDLDE